MATGSIVDQLRLALPALICFIPFVMGQWRWTSDQVNTTMCYWEQLRAAIVNDTVYLDGGRLWWLPGLADGQYDAVVDDQNPRGIVYALNFSVPFNTTQNATALLGAQELSKAPDAGAANNWGPDYYDGAMLANNHEFFLYGGLLRDTDAFSTPHEDDVTEYMQSQYGVQKDGFSPSFAQARLPSGLTRYLAYGGAANAPSENKAWYFSGMHAPGWGEIFTVGFNESLTAINVSNTLITLDMAVQLQENWTNATLPSPISGRANPELVWVPIGEQGILVALGGVVFPEFVNSIHKSDNETASTQESPKFMSTIDIYDVASKTWFQQPTTGGPGQLTRFCAVMSPAQDYSSFNIYLYGGYDGLHLSDPTAFNDDVWVLSLPSFTWTKVSSGTSKHARAGHKCVMPYPDLMMVFGGYAALEGAAPTCIDIIQLFNLSSTSWQTEYDPAVWANYSVPGAVFNKIGGTATGGATLTTPSSTTWAATALGQVFATPYPVSKLNSWRTYSPATTTNATNPDYTATPKHSGSGVPSFLAPLLGTILGLIFVTSVVVAFLLWRRRKYLKSRGDRSEAGTDDTGNRILAWMRGQPAVPKDPTITTSEDLPPTPATEMEQAAGRGQHPAFVHEMAGTPIAELADTSSRGAAELSDTGLSHVDVMNHHTHFAANARPPNDPSTSVYSSVSQPDRSSSVSQSDHASSVMRSANAYAAYARSQALSGDPRPDSPALGPAAAGPATAAAAEPTAARGESGVSDVSDRDRAHLRNISDPSTVSSMTSPTAGPRVVSGMSAAGGGAGGPIIEEGGEAQGEEGEGGGVTSTAVSPPTAEFRDGEDYLEAGSRSPGSAVVSPGSTVASPGSPLRRSVFHESRDDLGGSGS